MNEIITINEHNIVCQVTKLAEVQFERYKKFFIQEDCLHHRTGTVRFFLSPKWLPLTSERLPFLWNRENTVINNKYI